jgi:hypothetical protein
MAAAWLAIQRVVEGHGYALTDPIGYRAHNRLLLGY